MSYQEGDKTRAKRQYSKQAVALAMEGKWREAIAVNQNIIESFPDDVDAYNRLGRAHMELGEYSRARVAYEKAIQLDEYNTIAQRNLQRLQNLEDSVTEGEANYEKVEPYQFIEEVGKAGVVNLQKLGEPQVLAKTVAGARVNLKVSGSNLTVENGPGEYLGTIEPKHSQRLIRLMGGGNTYSAAVVSSTENEVSIIIRETYQDPSQAGLFSFPPKDMEAARSSADDRIDDRLIRRQLEEENSSSRETGYEIMGEGIEILTDDDSDDDDEDED